MRIQEEPRMSVMRGPRVVFVVLPIIATILLAGFARFEIHVGAGASEIDERAELELTPTGTFREFEADAKLELQIGEPGEIEFEASVIVEGDGVIEDIPYSMWLAQQGNIVLIDVDVADEKCVVDPVTGEEECEVVADLRADLALAFNITSLVGLTIIIREHFFRGGVGGDALVVLTGTVTAFDLN